MTKSSFSARVHRNFLFPWVLLVWLMCIPDAKSQELNGSGLVLRSNPGLPAPLYFEALKSADMEGYRLRDKRTLISFDTGIQFELLSAQEWALINPDIDPLSYLPEYPSGWVPPVFHLLENGMLGAQYPKTNPQAPR